VLFPWKKSVALGGRPILERSSNRHVARKRSTKKRTFTPNAGRCDVVIAHAQLEQELPLSSSDAKYYRTSAVSLEKKCSFGRRRVVLGKQGVVLGDNV
jgi:hypothetical protein